MEYHLSGSITIPCGPHGKKSTNSTWLIYENQKAIKVIILRAVIIENGRNLDSFFSTKRVRSPIEAAKLALNGQPSSRLPFERRRGWVVVHFRSAKSTVLL